MGLLFIISNQGDITVSKLNGRNPEEFAAYMALKDEDVVFQHPVVGLYSTHLPLLLLL